jgi:hypothetical protein
VHTSYLLYKITYFYNEISPTCFGSLLCNHHQGRTSSVTQNYKAASKWRVLRKSTFYIFNLWYVSNWENFVGLRTLCTPKYRPYFVKKADNSQNINFTAETRRRLRLTHNTHFDMPHIARQFLQTAVSVTEDRQSNDLLHVTHFSSKWQLAPFYKTRSVLHFTLYCPCIMITNHKLKTPTNALYFHKYSLMPLHM